MGSRAVIPYYNNSKEYIQKIISVDPLRIGFKLPTFDEYENEQVLNLPSSLGADLKTAIEQQYYEWYSWFNSPEDIRKYLAPIVGTSWDQYSNTPILTFPRFTPLIDEEEVYKYNNNENLILVGIRLKELEVDKTDVLTFLRAIQHVCDYLELNEEDIIYNPTNIGYHPVFGLRIIDYGLTK